jgi:hypothetical protein
MKQLILLLIILTSLGSLQAEISVKSFRKLENDLDARINYPLKDQNGEYCAIIKVVTTQKGYFFDGGMTGIVKTVDKPAEIWVYVPWGLKKITISHPQLGILRDYMLDVSVEKATVYELVLITGTVTTIVEETIESQWLVITPEPGDASVYINDVYINKGVHQAKLKPGNYNYRVEAPLYHPQIGVIQIADKKEELNILLKPNFGYIKVTSSPEHAAQVLIDDKALSLNTPATSDALKSGEYTVKVIKEMYQPYIQKITVSDGKTTEINAILQPNFAELTINAPAEASLYINNEIKGKGSWKGRLPAGVFSLEARLNQHRDAKQDVELSMGENRIVNLNPTPIYGSLDVITNPPGATITIDGKEYGTTPNTINKLLIGDYTVQLSRQGYATFSKTVSIMEGANALLNENLTSGREVTINSTPSGADLYIDGKAVGKTPYKGNLPFGLHELKVEKQGLSAVQNVIITESGGETAFKIMIKSIPTINYSQRSYRKTYDEYGLIATGSFSFNNYDNTYFGCQLGFLGEKKGMYFGLLSHDSFSDFSITCGYIYRFDEKFSFYAGGGYNKQAFYTLEGGLMWTPTNVLTSDDFTSKLITFPFAVGYRTSGFYTHEFVVTVPIWLLLVLVGL